jgi:site-specific DNA-methyltransferase (adenine-specific)
VSKKLGRQFLGFELSEEYATQIQKRLAKIHVGDALDGAPEPLVSVPATTNGRRLKRTQSAEPRPRKKASPKDQRRLPGIDR